MHLSGKRIVVVGLGASGVAAARLCLRRGASVVGTDAKEREALSEDARRLEQEGAKLVLGKHADMSGADLVVVSPGVPAFPALEAAEKAGTTVWGEVELAYRSLPGGTPVIAVGGTNGK